MINKDEKNQINPLTATVAGVIIGAGIGAGGAMALQDEKSRTRIRNVLTDAKNGINGYVSRFHKPSEEMKKEAIARVDAEIEKVEKVNKITHDASDKIEDVIS